MSANEHDPVPGLLTRPYPDPEDRKAVKKAYGKMAEGDPDTFAARFAVLLAAHCQAMETTAEQVKAQAEEVMKQLRLAGERLGETLQFHRRQTDEQVEAMRQEVARVSELALTLIEHAGRLQSWRREVYLVSAAVTLLVGLALYPALEAAWNLLQRLF